MIKIILSLWFILLIPSLAKSQTLKENTVACPSKELFDELTEAAARRDRDHFKWLAQNECIFTNREMKIAIIDQGITGWVKIRLFYSEGESLVLWTFIESVKWEPQK